MARCVLPLGITTIFHDFCYSRKLNDTLEESEKKISTFMSIISQ